MTEPASIRYKNPGAMWGKGNPIATKWGAGQTVNLNDGLGQGNNIAVFPTYVAGICAQIDLWRTARYKDHRFEDAIRTWSGGNYVESYISFVTSRVPGLTRNTVMNDAFWTGPMAIPFLKAQAWHEAGKPYPAPDGDWIEALHTVMSGTKLVITKVAPPNPVQVPPPPDIQPKSQKPPSKGPLQAAFLLLMAAFGSGAAAIKAHPQWAVLAGLALIGAIIAIVVHNKRKSQ